MSGFAFAESPSTKSEQQTVLEALNSLRAEIKAMRAELGQLRQVVTQIQRSTARPSQNPRPSLAKVDVSLGDGPRLGQATATVGIVEFTDFQCPFCKRYHDQTFNKIKAQYIDKGKVQYVVRDFPLAFHGQAKTAAIAAHCAQAQGDYWNMYHELFVNQRQLGSDLYEDLASRQGLNVEEFLTCTNDPVLAQVVDANLAYGKSIGVRGTPNFFIGRIDKNTLLGAKPLSGAQPFESFVQILDSLLLP